jgi:hypothetical protein
MAEMYNIVASLNRILLKKKSFESVHSFHSFTDFAIIQNNGFHRKHRIFLWLIHSRAPVRLDGYVIYQFLAIAVTLWIVKKSIVDDNKLTLDEGFSIRLIHSRGILLFDELSLLI